MKKSSKRLIITTHAKNGHGFRTRTAGIDLSDFNNNPLLLWMHKRPTGSSKDEVLPLGFWSDVELNGEELSGIPNFDEDDEFAMKIYRKVENRTIRMASAGLKPKEFKKDGEDLWLWESSLFEASLCDIGSNKEALAVSLYNEEMETVTLSDIYKPETSKNDSDMKIILNAPTLALLKLAEGVTEEAANKAVEELVTLAETQKTTIQTLTEDKRLADAAKAELQTKLDAQVTLAETEKRNALVDKAIADRKITADQKPFIIGLAEKDFEGTKKYLESIKASPSVKDSIDLGEDADGELLKLTYDELDKANKLITLKEQNPEAFKEKFKKKFNKEYQG